ncbi:hypothetical protein [Nocardioides sp. GY 10127]|uniref:hypothetical protein n=1 Tax=Nocardioides sp. GY 10127 TaxID=2569762 RepID=UPI0010A8FBBA|nr:hypothetical protein [Nocardioides sp. GY 10127]TIC86481.1 hypothetical protein E8D37_00835 [Nocardioides sp. GY 10127]
MTHVPAVFADADPFDLPEWLGELDVVWAADSGLRTGFQVAGRLTAGDLTQVCDLLAVDEAYPVSVATDDVRTRAHRAWRHRQVLVLVVDDRLTLAVPGREFTADLVLEALARLAKAVGASPERYSALLRIGGA